MMEATAARAPASSVRVTWAASLAVEIGSPKHGVVFDTSGQPKILMQELNYGQSKCGNLFFATEHARRFKDSKVVHLVSPIVELACIMNITDD